MQPRGILMAEHRLIEYMLDIIVKETAAIKNDGLVDLSIIASIIDFIRVYADENHHGKEEKILFAALAKKPLSEDLSNMMQELVAEHIAARGMVAKLVEAKTGYGQGDVERIKDVVAGLEALAAIYPPHIKKEDENFFLRTEHYFTDEELSEMAERFKEFDSQMIHKKYQALCNDLAQKYR